MVLCRSRIARLRRCALPCRRPTRLVIDTYVPAHEEAGDHNLAQPSARSASRAPCPLARWGSTMMELLGSRRHHRRNSRVRGRAPFDDTRRVSMRSTATASTICEVCDRVRRHPLGALGHSVYMVNWGMAPTPDEMHWTHSHRVRRSRLPEDYHPPWCSWWQQIGIYTSG